MNININSVNSLSIENNIVNKHASAQYANENNIVNKAEQEKLSKQDGCYVELSQTSEAYTDYVSKVDRILEKIGNGQAVSDRDRQWLESEVQNMLSGQNDIMANSHFKNQDVLDGIKEDLAEKNKRFNDMMSELKDDEVSITGNSAQAVKEFNIKSQEELIDKFRKNIEETDEDAPKNTSIANETYKEEFFTDGFIEKYIDREFKKIEDDISKDIIRFYKEAYEE